jgi:hypothetical protein
VLSRALEDSCIDIRQTLGELLGVNLVAPLCLMARRSIGGWVVVPPFDVIVCFNIYLSDDGTVETIADGDVVIGGRSHLSKNYPPNSNQGIKRASTAPAAKETIAIRNILC